MTKETKDLFEYCRAAVRIVTKDVNSGLNHFQTSEEKVIKQLDELEAKLKKMEVYLTKGGIILDRNGKQCHVGDKVKWKTPNSKFEGKLIFDPNTNQIMVTSPCQVTYVPIKNFIELIEKVSESITFITPDKFKTCNGTAFVSDIDGNEFEVLYKSQAYDFFLRMDYFSRMADKKPVRMTFKNDSTLVYKAELVEE